MPTAFFSCKQILSTTTSLCVTVAHAQKRAGGQPLPARGDDRVMDISEAAEAEDSLQVHALGAASADVDDGGAS